MCFANSTILHIHITWFSGGLTSGYPAGLHGETQVDLTLRACVWAEALDANEVVVPELHDAVGVQSQGGGRPIEGEGFVFFWFEGPRSVWELMQTLFFSGFGDLSGV